MGAAVLSDGAGAPTAEVMQQSNTRDMIFPVPKLIAFLSQAAHRGARRRPAVPPPARCPPRPSTAYRPSHPPLAARPAPLPCARRPPLAARRSPAPRRDCAPLARPTAFCCARMMPQTSAQQRMHFRTSSSAGAAERRRGGGAAVSERPPGDRPGGTRQRWGGGASGAHAAPSGFPSATVRGVAATPPEVAAGGPAGLNSAKGTLDLHSTELDRLMLFRPNSTRIRPDFGDADQAWPDLVKIRPAVQEIRRLSFWSANGAPSVYMYTPCLRLQTRRTAQHRRDLAVYSGGELWWPTLAVNSGSPFRRPVLVHVQVRVHGCVYMHHGCAYTCVCTCSCTYTCTVTWSCARACVCIRAGQGTTLLPGTVILTGTPEGVGFARKPPVYLKAGDTVTIAIEGIGELTNSVVAASE